MLSNTVIALLTLGVIGTWVRFSTAWSASLRWFRVLWVCRVSAASVLVGLLLMTSVPQAQDVFADTSVQWWFWLAFLILIFFGWALPVHYAARRILDRQEWALPGNLAEPLRSAEADRLRTVYAAPIKWVPRLLGIACFVAVELGLWRAWDNLEPASGIPLVREAMRTISVLAGFNVLAAVLFTLFVLRRRRMLKDMSTSSGVEAPFGLTESGRLWLEQILSPRFWRESRQASRREFTADLISAATAIVISAAFVLVFVDPFLVAGTIPRALFLVFMLGAWVLALTYLAAWSHKLRAPVLLTLAFGLALISTFSPAFHNVRVIENTSDLTRPASDRQLTFAAAVERWMHANRCTPDRPSECPSPIIVAGQGGASRAAFFTAGVFGTALDRSRAAPEVQRDFARQVFALSTVSGSSAAAVMIRAALEDVDPSTSSWRTGPCAKTNGGLWFGDVLAADQPVQGSWRACLQKLTSGDFLSPVFVGIAIRDVTSVRRWFYDLKPWWQDRATLLERAWEQRYDDIVSRNSDVRPFRDPRGLERPFGYPAKLARESWTPLLFLNGSSVETGRRILVSDVKPWECHTFPDGKRGVRSWLQEGYDVFEILGSGKKAPVREEDPCALPKLASADATALTLSGITAADQAGDLRLSTGALLSARFPIISPPGVLRNQDDDAVDRVVDGGYFENDGLATAADIGRILVEHGLRPVILHITNDPIESKHRPTPPPAEDDAREGSAIWRDPRPEPSPTLPDAADVAWVQSLTTPLKGLYQTRAGHGAEAANAAVRLVENLAWETICKDASDCPAHYLRVAVYDHAPGRSGDVELPEVSMSWWLSQPVQAYLDAQLAHPQNRCALDILAWHLSFQPSSSGSSLAFRTPDSCSSEAGSLGVPEEQLVSGR
jgi:hypothetical protein